MSIDGRFATGGITTRFLLHDIPVDISCEELYMDLTEIGIYPLEVRRFTRRMQGGDTPSTTVLITKLGLYLPNEIKLWYQNHKISLFSDRPRQCTKCWEFTHTTKNCQNLARCKRCGKVHSSSCEATSPECLHCHESHEADDKICSRYQDELTIQKLKSTHHISISEARRQFKINQSTAAKSYAATVSKKDEGQDTVSTSELCHFFKNELQNLMNGVVSQIQTMMSEVVQIVTQDFKQGLQESIQQAIQPVVQSVSDSVQQMCLRLPTDRSATESSPTRKITKILHKDSNSHETSHTKLATHGDTPSTISQKVSGSGRGKPVSAGSSHSPH